MKSLKTKFYGIESRYYKPLGHFLNSIPCLLPCLTIGPPLSFLPSSLFCPSSSLLAPLNFPQISIHFWEKSLATCLIPLAPDDSMTWWPHIPMAAAFPNGCCLPYGMAQDRSLTKRNDPCQKILHSPLLVSPEAKDQLT